MSRLTFFVGCARSGKSTIARKWANYEVDLHDGEISDRTHLEGKTSAENPRVIVNADTIRLQFGHRFYGPNEEFVHAIKNLMIKTLLASNHDVLVDGTHTTKGSIVKNFEIDSNADYAFVKTTPEVCKQRAIDTNQPDLLPVIDRMWEQMNSLPPIEDIRQEIKARKR